MTFAFKFRYVNELVGAMVLLVVAILLGGLALAGQSHKWFQPTTTVYFTLPPDGVNGLKPGAQVLILGTSVGQVNRIDIDTNGAMTAVASIRSDFAKFLNTGSVAYLRREFAVAGDADLDIDRGSGAPLSTSKPTLKATLDTSTTTMINDTIQQVRDEVTNQVVPLIQSLRTAVEAYTVVAQDLHNPDGNLQQALGHLGAVAGNVQNGQGLVGKLLTDKQMADTINDAIGNVDKSTVAINGLLANMQDQLKLIPAMVNDTHQAVVQVQSLIGDLDKTAQQMPALLVSVDRTMKEMPGLVLQTQETMRQTTRLIESLQRSWLLGGSGKGASDTSGQRINPDEVQVSN